MTHESLSPGYRVTAAVSPDLPLAAELAAVATRMSGVLLSDETLATVLGLITALAVETVPAASGAGVTLTDEFGRPTTRAATDPRVERADMQQYELREGPCLATLATRTPQRVDDTASERRWPRWASAAQEMGLVATLSVPLMMGERSLGAMKVYSDRVAAFDDRAERLLGLFATQASILVVNVQSQEDARRMSDDLRKAVSHRDVIAQAKGILMHSRRVDEAGAFALLVAASQREDKSLYDVASELVTTTVRRRR